MKWFKNNWMVVLLGFIVAFVIWSKFDEGTLYDKLMTDYNAQAAAYSAQIEAIEKVNAEMQAEQERLDTEYNERLENIQTQFSQELAKVSKQRRIERRSLVKAAKQDPTILTKEIRRVFGIPIYSPEKVK